MADYAIHDTTLTGISNVIRKKEGSSALIDPADYPKRINLMGMLEEKTIVSSPIADFSDGADDVPTKSLVVTIPPTLSGVSSVVETQTGKNLIDLSSLVDGYVNSNGTFNTNHSKGEMRSGFIPVKPDTTYYFSIVETTGTEDAWVGIGEYTSNDGTGFIRRDSFWRFTTSSTAKYVVVSARNLAQATKIQLEIGNDPTTWEAYTPIKQYTASLGRTIYGGTADIVNGVGKERQIEVKLKDLAWVYSTAYGGFFHSASLASIVSGDTYICLPSEYTNMRLNSSAITNNDDVIGVNADNGSAVTGAVAFKSIVLKDTDYSSASDLVAHLEQTDSTIIITIATPTDFTFTGQEINTRLGYNAFWSDSGDTEVTYRASGTIYQYPSGEEASF